MITIDNNKIIMSDRTIEFNEKIIEAVDIDNKLIVVFETNKDDGFDNVYCYEYDKTELWRIKPVPKEIVGTARTPYVGVDKKNGSCQVVDFFGRRFKLNTSSGEILSKDIVK